MINLLVAGKRAPILKALNDLTKEDSMFKTTIKVNVANAIANTTANKRAGAFDGGNWG